MNSKKMLAQCNKFAEHFQYLSEIILAGKCWTPALLRHNFHLTYNHICGYILKPDLAGCFTALIHPATHDLKKCSESPRPGMLSEMIFTQPVKFHSKKKRKKGVVAWDQ